MSDARCKTARQTWTNRTKWFALAAAVMTMFPCPLMAEDAGSNGIRFGRARVHPFFDFFSYYQTNPGRITGEGGVSDVSLTIRPGFNLDYPGRSYEFYSTGNFEYRHYMGLNAVTDAATDSTNTQELSSFMGALSLDGKLLKNSSFPLKLKTEFNRSDKPKNQSQNQTLARNTYSGEVGTDWAPGGGALKVGLNYKPVVSDYDGEENDTLDALSQKVTLTTQWRFLPKTATFLEGVYSHFGYLNPDAAFSLPLASGVTVGGEGETEVAEGEEAASASSSTGKNVEVPISSAYWGLSGQITPRISTIMKFGYGQTMEEGDGQASGFLTQLDIKYKVSESTTYSGGYARTLAGAVLFQHMMTNRIYLKGKMTLARRFALGASVEYDMVDYGAVVTDPSRADRRSDSVLRAEVVASAKITNWFVASLVNKYESLSTDYVLTEGAAPSYGYNDTFLRLSMRY